MERAAADTALEVVCCGDLVLDEPDPDHWLGGLADRLGRSDLAIGHLEVPHTRHQPPRTHDVPAPGAPPEHLAALPRAGFGLVTLAGNHIADCGATGIEDTVRELERLGIRHTGAGRDLAAAIRPAWFEQGAHRIAVLSFNCVGPEESWAGPRRAGCAHVRVRTEDGRPTAPAAPLAWADPDSVAAMQAEIRAVRTQGATTCIVALHKGIVHTPAVLAPYERPLARAAIDAGADVVIGHHAHILRGIEFHQGRPIYHGLGNGCVVTRALSPDDADPKRAAWALRRRQLFGFEPDPAYFLAPFHPEAVHGMLAHLSVRPSGECVAGISPLWFEPPGRPVLAGGERATLVCRYLDRIGRQAGLPGLAFAPGDTAIRISPA